MKETDKVTLKAFAKYVGCNYSYLSILCIRGNGNGVAIDRRFLKGIEMPLPIDKLFHEHGKRWWGSDVIKFKKALDGKGGESETFT